MSSVLERNWKLHQQTLSLHTPLSVPLHLAYTPKHTSVGLRNRGEKHPPPRSCKTAQKTFTRKMNAKECPRLTNHRVPCCARPWGAQDNEKFIKNPNLIHLMPCFARFQLIPFIRHATENRFPVAYGTLAPACSPPYPRQAGCQGVG